MPKFDIAVLGAGIAGLSIAALMSRAGKTVVLTDPRDRAGGSVAVVAKDGFLFSAGSNAVYGFEPGGSIHALLSSLDKVIDEPVRAARYQVVLPDRRITVAPGQQETLDELRREYPREIDRMVSLYRDAGKIAQNVAASRISAYLATRRSAGRFLGKYHFSPELLAYLSVQSRYFFGQSLDTLPLGSLVLMLCSAPTWLPGGYDGLVSRLASLCPGHHGSILWNEPWPTLQIRGRVASGIMTSQGVIETRAVCINADNTGSEQALFLGIHEAVLPVSMEHTVLCIDDYQRPDDYFSLAVGPNGMNAPENMRALTAVFSVRGAVHATQELLMDRLRAVIPFLEDFVVTITAPDGAARHYVFPEQFAPRIYSSHTVQPRRKTFKNVLMLPDSARNILTSVRTAQMVAARLL